MRGNDDNHHPFGILTFTVRPRDIALGQDQDEE